MIARHGLRIGLLVVLALSGTACAHGGADVVPATAWGAVTGPMCSVRVVSGYDLPVEAAATAGAREVRIGEVGAHDEVEFDVPCAHRAVTVYRVVRNGPEGEARLGARSRALHADEVTVISLRPMVGTQVSPPRR